MTRRGAARRVSFAALALALAATDTRADELTRCAAIDAPEKRLACYDRLAGRPPAGSASASGAGTARAAALPAATLVGGPAPPTPAASPGTSFGDNRPRFSAAAEEPASIQAVVVGITQSRAGPMRLELDNGQTWTVSDSDVRLERGDPVTIRRASLGSYLMQTPSRRSYRVMRAQ